MTDHERIYLEPSPGADEDYGRQWCQHNVWDEATEYVRADLHEALTEERDRLREALQFYANPEIYKPHPHGPAFDRRDLSFHARAALSPPTAEGREP